MKDSKKALTATIAETKIEDNVVEMLDCGGNVLNTSTSVINNT